MTDHIELQSATVRALTEVIELKRDPQRLRDLVKVLVRFRERARRLEAVNVDDLEFDFLQPRG